MDAASKNLSAETVSLERGLRWAAAEHQSDFSRWSRWQNWLGVVAASLTGVLGVGFIARPGDTPGNVAGAALAIASAVLTATLASLQPSKKAADHQRAAIELRNLATRFEILRNLRLGSEASDEQLLNEFEGLVAERDRIVAALPIPSKRAVDRVRRAELHLNDEMLLLPEL